MGGNLRKEEIQRAGVAIEASKRGDILGGGEQLSSFRILSNKVEDLD